MQELASKADATKKSYVPNFNRFLKRWDLTAGLLYEMRKRDQVSSEPVDRKRIEGMVKTSMKEMTKNGYKASSASMIGKAVSSFLSTMDMDLKLKSKDKPQGEVKGKRAATKTQILLIYNAMVYRFYLRNRALLLIEKDSGLRASDISTMDYGYWLLAETILNKNGESFKVFDPELTQKMKVLAYIHLGPESVAAIEEYLNDRQDEGEILTEDSPLFINSDGYRLTADRISHIVRYRCKKLKLRNISGHSNRKFHKTRLEGTGMAKDWINKLQGKKADEYSLPEDDPSNKYPGFSMLTERYINGYYALRVLEKPIDERENERLREELERVRAQTPPELTTMGDRLNVMENKIVQILEIIGG